MADVPSPQDLEALDRVIEARRRAMPLDAGGLPPDLLAVAATAQALQALATAAGADLDRAATWARVRRGMQASPRTPGRTRRPFPALLPRRLPALATAAAVAAAVAIAVTLSVLLSKGTAEAEFLQAVQDLTDSSQAALRDGHLTSEESADLEAKIARVAGALDEDPTRLQKIETDRLAAAFADLLTVQAELTPVERAETPPNPSLSASITTLTAVTTTVQEELGQREPIQPPAEPARPSAEPDASRQRRQQEERRRDRQEESERRDDRQSDREEPNEGDRDAPPGEPTPARPTPPSADTDSGEDRPRTPERPHDSGTDQSSGGAGEGEGENITPDRREGDRERIDRDSTRPPDEEERRRGTERDNSDRENAPPCDERPPQRPRDRTPAAPCADNVPDDPPPCAEGPARLQRDRTPADPCPTR